MTRVALNLAFDRTEPRELAERAARMANVRPAELTEFEKALMFMRSVHTRAALVLPAFYLYLGASCRASAETCNYPKHRACGIGALLIARHYCNHLPEDLRSRPKKMIGRHFAKCSMATFEKLAEYWAEESGQDAKTVSPQIALLQLFFNECSDSTKDLLNGETMLHKRLGLLKQYANNRAAHLTMDDFEIGFLDCAHAVAALTVVGCIIRSFDNARSQPAYFDELDTAAWDAAVSVFPALVGKRMFDNFNVGEQAAIYWRWDTLRGRDMLMEHLPQSIGWSSVRGGCCCSGTLGG